MKNIIIPQNYKPVIDKISAAAKENGFEVYIVGGFVRDLLLKRQPKDLDIMVCGGKNIADERLAGINFSKILAGKYKLSSPVVFEKFGTSKLFIDGREVEFVMPRKEYYNTDSRNPQTRLGSLEQDALRRDFTVNALFLRLSDMRVLDFTRQGLIDIKNKIIRVTDTENAEIIFKQDPLRILRALRQSLQLRFKIESKTYDAMKISSPRIRIVSPERVRDEINKILAGRNPSEAFKIMHEINLLTEILPEVERLNNLCFSSYGSENPFTRIVEILDKTRNNIILRMALLLYFTGKYNYKYKKESSRACSHECNTDSVREADIVLSRLKYPKEFIKKTLFLIRARVYPEMHLSCVTDAEIRKFAKKCSSGLNLILEFLQAEQTCAAARGKIAKLKKRIEYLRSKNILYVKPLLNGKEIINISGGSAGRWIQEAKNKIEEIQFENPEFTKEEAIEIIKKEFNKRKLNA